MVRHVYCGAEKRKCEAAQNLFQLRGLSGAKNPKRLPLFSSFGAFGVRVLGTALVVDSLIGSFAEIRPVASSRTLRIEELLSCLGSRG